MKRTRRRRSCGRRSVTGACGQRPDSSSMGACRAVAPDRAPRHGSSRRTQLHGAGARWMGALAWESSASAAAATRWRMRRDGSSERPAAAVSARCAPRLDSESSRCHGQNQGALESQGRGVRKTFSRCRAGGRKQGSTEERTGADLAGMRGRTVVTRSGEPEEVETRSGGDSSGWRQTATKRDGHTKKSVRNGGLAVANVDKRATNSRE